MKITLENAILVLLAIAVIATGLGFAWHDEREAQRRLSEYEAATRATADAQRRADRERFERASVAERLDFCLEKLPPRPMYGIAVHPERIDALYRWGPSLQGLRRYACDGTGLSEAHVDAPIGYRMIESDATNEDRVLSAARAALGTAELIEVVLAADGASVVTRRSHFVSGQARSDVQPADAAAFPWISTAPPVLALPSHAGAIAAVRSWPTHRWLHEHALAFQQIATTIAAERLQHVTGIDLQEDRITLSFQRLPLDADAAYAQIEIDRYGVASWPAPFVEPPGFSCARGIALEDISRQFLDACDLRGCRDNRRPTIASYGCSSGPDGGWTIRLPKHPSPP